MRTRFTAEQVGGRSSPAGFPGGVAVRALLIPALLLLCALAGPVFSAPVNVALGRPIIDVSGTLGGFAASEVTDGDFVEGSQTGYWLGLDGTESFTLDLQSVRDIQSIGLRNTHNAGSYDRGTRAFRVYASATVDGSNQLISPQLVLDSRLPRLYGWSPLPRTDFTSDMGLTPVSARYLRFDTVSSAYNNNQVGLNEIEVFEEKLPAFQQPAPSARRIVDAGGSYSGSFTAMKALDGSYTDTFGSDYWLSGGELQPQITVDLGDLYFVDEIRLRNTHNDGYNDRGTRNFQVYGADSLNMFYEPVNPVLILTGSLSTVSGQSPVPTDIFGSGQGLLAGNYRYLQFVPLTGTYGNTNFGLNEFDADTHPPVIPEPATLALLGLATALLAPRRRR